MKESRPRNVTSHRARRAAPTTTPIEFEQERKEIIAIAEMLTDGEKIFYLLGAARALLRIEAQERPPVT